MSNFFHILGQILTLIGSLGLFLYGMKLMSEALQKVAGSKMRQILAAMTSNPLKGAFTGFLVTTTIQSSSATTVMIVSFVNAGLISLVASVGVIMGANIGTTVTAWLIAILGFKVSLSFLSLPLIGISFPLFFSKNSTRKSWGEFIIGFAILFIGLQFLKENVPGIDNAETLSFLSSLTDMGFISTLIFVMVGTILTVIIQSSSATMALTLVMCYNGLITFEMAAAMVLGENIGTTITANIAAYVANVSAKRAARAHLIFNIFGVVWMLIVFHPFLRGIDWFLQERHGASLLNTNLSVTDFDSIKWLYPIGLAVFHTSFNIINTAALLGFAPFIAKVATRMVPDKGEDDEEFRLQFISTSFVSTSEIALVQARQEIASFAIRLEKMFGFIKKLSTEEHNKKYYKTLAKIEKYEDITDNMEVEIANYLTKVSEGEISHESSKKIRTMLKMIDDMESVGDAIYQLSLVFDNYKQSKSQFTDYQIASLNGMFELIDRAFEEMRRNLDQEYKDADTSGATEIEKKINKKRNMLRKQHVEDLKEKKYKHKTGTFYSDMFSITEKIGDYIINVSEAIEEYQEND
ncbi:MULTISPECIES: Na/Pi cotransporter family protein [unclassified Lentimicrobium]|uniref:Na/Pi cotransporter family protein n=1 Tax=unclassified Lentimicrobium TaxID=2677434 RepID=UPI00155329F8|nr:MULTISPECIES: Na/Pi cotransporter family protein [unclassified Lentimicrobium]NPD44101.1 Na/Pi cotransporter family protein [Lentimicrobium sp. S6]NPD86230.1 Na/Pi cotransporter family protein [Lentimicrobium sp. L6]